MSPHIRVLLRNCLYISVVCCTISYFHFLCCAFLHHSLIEKLFTNWTWTIYLLDGDKTTHGLDLPIQWLEQWQKVLICQHNNGSHSLHRVTSPLAAAMGHVIKDGENALFVHTTRVYILITAMCMQLLHVLHMQSLRLHNLLQSTRWY